MVALSYFSNSDTTAAMVDDPELQALLYGADHFFNPNDFFFSDDFANGVLPFDNSFFRQQPQLDPFCFTPKRQKICECNPPPPPFFYFPAASYGAESCERREPTAASVSAQSAAARRRRRRITEKTQELGRLVPGGKKMTTAEMLQSAYKYIKFLQAQITLLEFIGFKNQEAAEAPVEGEGMFQNLLESPLIQEKLYSTENCLMPHKLVEGSMI